MPTRTPKVRVAALELNGEELATETEHEITADEIPFTAAAAAAGISSVYLEDGLLEVVARTASGRVAPEDFTGSPKKATVTFATAFPTNNYSVTIEGADGRLWAPEAITTTGFVINSQANAQPISLVYWTATLNT